MCEPFKLESMPERVVLKERFENESARQLGMFAGMDCLPDQLDLFQTDGELEER